MSCHLALRKPRKIETPDVDDLLAEAARRLLRLETAPGAVCSHCGGMQAGTAAACPRCGRALEPVDLAEAMGHRVVTD